MTEKVSATEGSLMAALTEPEATGILAKNPKIPKTRLIRPVSSVPPVMALIKKGACKSKPATEVE